MPDWLTSIQVSLQFSLILDATFVTCTLYRFKLLQTEPGLCLAWWCLMYKKCETCEMLCWHITSPIKSWQKNPCVTITNKTLQSLKKVPCPLRSGCSSRPWRCSWLPSCSCCGAPWSSCRTGTPATSSPSLCRWRRWVRPRFSQTFPTFLPFSSVFRYRALKRTGHAGNFPLLP